MQANRESSWEKITCSEKLATECLFLRRAAIRKLSGILLRHLELSIWFTPGQGVRSLSPLILPFQGRTLPREVQGPRINLTGEKNMFLFLPDYQVVARIFFPITEHR